MHKYSLHLPQAFLVIVFGVWAVVTLGVIGAMIATLVSGLQQGPPVAFWLLVVLRIGFNWYFLLRIPHTMIWRDGEASTFVSVVRRVTAAPNGIRSIKLELRAGMGFLVVRYATRKLLLFNQFDGFHKFITRVESANPAVEIRGG